MSAKILSSETHSGVENKLFHSHKINQTGIRPDSITYAHTFGITKHNCFRGEHD